MENKKIVEEIINRHLETAYVELMSNKKNGDITPGQQDALDKATDEIKRVMLEVLNQNK